MSRTVRNTLKLRPNVRAAASAMPPAYVIVSVFAAAVGVISLRYALPSQPGAAPLPNAKLNPVPLTVHAISAALALIIMPLQLHARFRARHPRIHRIAGRTYAGLVGIAAISALLIAPSATGGTISAAGFTGLAVSWIFTTGAGIRAALGRHYDEHRWWMVRSSALTFSAVTLRLLLVLARILGFDFVGSYRAIAWLCWLPNLVFAEWWLRRHPRVARDPAPTP